MASTIGPRTLILGALVLGAATSWALWPRPIDVDTAEIRRGDVEVRVEDEGLTRIREVYAVSAPMAGKVRRAPVKVGDPVTAGETVVATIEPADPTFLDDRTERVAQAAVEAARAAVELAEAQTRQARAQLDFASSELQRARQLTARQATSERALDQALLNAASAEAALASAQATLDLRRHELQSAEAQRLQPNLRRRQGEDCCVSVRAPVSGKVLKLVVESEQVVQAGQALVETGDPNDIEIVVDLLSRDAVRIAPGAAVTILNWGGPGALAGRVRRIEPAGFIKVSALGIEESRVRTLVDIAAPRAEWSRLGHGFRIIAEITVERAENVPAVPVGALFRRGERWMVYAVREGRATLVPVELGARNLRQAEIRAGLGAGETVVLYPSDRLKDGVAITPRPGNGAP